MWKCQGNFRWANCGFSLARIVSAASEGVVKASRSCVMCCAGPFELQHPRSYPHHQSLGLHFDDRVRDLLGFSRFSRQLISINTYLTCQLHVEAVFDVRVLREDVASTGDAQKLISVEYWNRHFQELCVAEPHQGFPRLFCLRYHLYVAFFAALGPLRRGLDQPGGFAGETRGGNGVSRGVDGYWRDPNCCLKDPE